jgi:hypothetical protein
MSCKVCAYEQLLDCPAEFNLHLPGLERIAQPSIYFSRKMLVCTNCGNVELVIPALKLEELRRGMKDSTNGNGHLDNIGTAKLYGFGSSLYTEGITDSI